MTDFSQIAGLLAELRAVTGECRDRDRVEYESAVAALEGCGEKRMISAAEARERLDYPMRMIDYIENATDRYYKEGFAVPEELARLAARWAELSGRVAEIREQASRLTLDGWQGAGSAGYRARVPVFCDDLTNIANLASSTARNSGLARQDIQVINDKYEKAIRTALDGVRDARKKEVRTDWPSAEWWRSWNADWSNKEQYEFTFFERSANAGVALLRAAEQLREWVLTFQPDSAAAQALDRDVAEMGGKVQDNGLAVGIVASPGAVSKTGR